MKQKLESAVEQLKQYATKYDIVNAEVSKSAVGWHIEHSLLVIDGVVLTMLKSEASEYQKPKFSLIRSLILLLGKIPRGRGKAPDRVIPLGEITVETLNRHLANVSQSIEKTGGLSPDKYFTHPVFGNLKRDKALRFLEVHTLHHLRIIEDILK